MQGSALTGIPAPAAPAFPRCWAGSRPRSRSLSADDEPRVRDGVMRRAERSVANQRHVAGQHAGHGVAARHVQRFGRRHARDTEGVEGMTRASSVLPEPGGPDIKMFWTKTSQF